MTVQSAQKGPNINLRWAQGEVFNCDKRFRVLVAGRRFGKSYLSCIELLRELLRSQGKHFFIVRLLTGWRRI